jgi:hypothetical protein
MLQKNGRSIIGNRMIVMIVPVSLLEIFFTAIGKSNKMITGTPMSR